MKLIELLTRELKEWPCDGPATQDSDKEVRFNSSSYDFFATELADDASKSFGGGAEVTREEWEAAVAARPTDTIPTLETMLTEWRDLEARAQAAQAEADALFEHAAQCHGEIVVRLAELGWGAPRGRSEPVVTLDEVEAWIVDGHTAPDEATHYGDHWTYPYWYYFADDKLYVKSATDDDVFDPRDIGEYDRETLIPSLISRPSKPQ